MAIQLAIPAVAWGALAAAPWVFKGAQVGGRALGLGSKLPGATNVAGRAVGALGPRQSYLKNVMAGGSHAAKGPGNFAAAPWTSMGKAFKAAPFGTSGRTALGVGMYGPAPFMLGQSMFGGDGGVPGSGGNPSGFIGPPAPGQSPGQLGAPVDPYDAMRSRMLALQGSLGLGMDPGPTPVAPDFLTLLKSPEVQSYVDSQIGSMQAPYNAAINRREKRGGQQKDAIVNIGAGYARQSKELQRGAKAERQQYAGESAARRESAADQLGKIADNLIGSSTVDPVFQEKRAQQQADSVARMTEGVEQQAGAVTGGSFDTEETMRGMDAVERMREAEDMRLAREQMDSDITDLETQAASIAGQSPELARQFASDIYSSEANKYKAASEMYLAKIKSASDLGQAIADKELENVYGTGGETTFGDFWNDYLGKESTIVTAKGETAEGGVSQEIPIRLSQMLTPEDIAMIEGAFQQGGAGMASQVIASMTNEIRPQISEYVSNVYGY